MVMWRPEATCMMLLARLRNDVRLVLLHYPSTRLTLNRVCSWSAEYRLDLGITCLNRYHVGYSISDATSVGIKEG